jgi:predicted Ser/Thr protein kinase/tetratricopeptide (TPR) repeat protein
VGDDDEELARGRALGRYVVLDRLGRGAMGSVYAAYDPELARRVALKVLRPGAAARQGHEAARQRLVREAQALARLAHPNVVKVFDVGTDEGRVFLAMELVEGQSLRRWLEPSRGWREALEILEQAGRGLAAAHALGLVHRDFKPDNVLVAEDGRVRVGDFGLVRRVDDEARREPPTRDVDDAGDDANDGAGAVLTAVGDALGTPAYMAPEQHEGEEAGPRADQFAFCVTAFEALYGRRPFTEGDRAGLLAAKRRGVELGPRGAAGRVPASVRAVLRRGLSPAPGDRFAAMEPLLDALARARARAGMGRFATVAGVVVLGAVGMAVVRPGEAASPCADAGAAPSAAWDEASREAVRERLDAHRPDDTVERAVMGLDRRAAAWAEADRDACEDTWIRGEQSSTRLAARRECLRGQWLELEETVALLREADAGTAAHGEALVEGLPGPGECERARAPALGRAEELRRTLARVAVLRRAGRVDEAWAELEAPSDDDEVEVEAGGGGPARALARGELLAERGELEASEEELRRALHLARAAGDERVEADAWLALGEAALAREADGERARFYAEMATAAVKATGGDPTREARAEALLREIAGR